MEFGGENNGMANAAHYMALRELDRRFRRRRAGQAARFSYWAGGLLTRWGRALQMRNQIADVQAGKELAMGEWRR